MGVSKKSGAWKWMVFSMENPLKMDDLGVPLFFGTTHISRNYARTPEYFGRSFSKDAIVDILEDGILVGKLPYAL